MARIRQQDTRQKRSGIKGGVVAAGALAGAAIGAAAGALLSDEKTRRDVAHKLGELKDQALETSDRVREEVEPMGDTAKRKIRAGKRKIQKH